MKLLILKTKDPYYNLAVEEYLFRYGKGDYFILWQNAPTVVIGKNQNLRAEVSTDQLEKNGIKLARRITGGGAVYHDLGNLNYSYVSDSRGEGTIDFESYVRPVAEALRSLDLDVNLSGRNDLMINDKKISGNAQYSANGRTLHHGTLLFDTDLGVLDRVLTVDEEKIRSKAISSARMRVTNIRPLLKEDMSLEELVDLIAERIRREMGAQDVPVPVSEEIDRLSARNASEQWLDPDTGIASMCSVKVKKRYHFGSVEACAELKGNVIERIRLCGDYFELSPVERLEQALAGCAACEPFILPSGICASDHIFGMTDGDLSELLALLSK